LTLIDNVVVTLVVYDLISERFDTGLDFPLIAAIDVCVKENKNFLLVKVYASSAATNDSGLLPKISPIYPHSCADN